MSFVPTIFAPWRPVVFSNAFQEEVDESFIDRLNLPVRTAIVSMASFALLFNKYPSSPEKLFFSLPIACGWVALELWRTSRALHQLSIRLFKDEDAGSPSLMEYMIQHPEAVREILNEPQLLQKRCSKTGKTLLDLVLTNSYEQLKVFDLLIQAPDLQTKEVLIKLVRNNQPWYALHALKQGYFQIDDTWSVDDQLQVWREVKDSNVMRALAQNGWDVNVKNAQGITPIKQFLLKEINEKSYISNRETFYRFLSLGAQFPPLDEPIYSDMFSFRNTTLRALLEKNPYLIPAWRHAEKQAKDTIFNPLEDEKSSLLVTALYSTGEFHIRESAIILRIAGVALGVLMATVPLTLLHEVGAYVVCPYLLASLAAFIFYKYAWRQAEDILYTHAEKGLGSTFPSHGLTKLLLEHPKLVDRMIQGKYDFNKIDDSGKTVWETLFSIDKYSRWPITSSEIYLYNKLFPRLIHKSESDRKKALFAQVIRSGCDHIVDHLLKTKLIVPEDNCFELWSDLKSVAIARTLKKYGLSPNTVTNKFGLTPLIYTLGMIHQMFERVRALLEAGAAVTPEALAYTNVTPEVKALLELYFARP